MAICTHTPTTNTQDRVTQRMNLYMGRGEGTDSHIISAPKPHQTSVYSNIHVGKQFNVAYTRKITPIHTTMLNIYNNINWPWLPPTCQILGCTSGSNPDIITKRCEQCAKVDKKPDTNVPYRHARHPSNPRRLYVHTALLFESL